MPSQQTGASNSSVWENSANYIAWLGQGRAGRTGATGMGRAGRTGRQVWAGQVTAEQTGLGDLDMQHQHAMYATAT